MFEDSCTMCGKPTAESLYCSSACKSQDSYHNLDDTPLLVPSRAHHSLSSSPTSSVMTSLSISDDLPPQLQVQASNPFYGTTTAAAVAAAFARTSMPPTPGDIPRGPVNSKFSSPIQPPNVREIMLPALTSTRKHQTSAPIVDVDNTLHYARRPAHQRSASSSVASLLMSAASSTYNHTHEEKTVRNNRKQQRASLPAYFSLLETPLVVQTLPPLRIYVADPVPEADLVGGRLLVDRAMELHRWTPMILSNEEAGAEYRAILKAEHASA
ncbi:hypothetical protein BDV93DRAFT_502833 [Ceratobasidium sp. AG-I]|nr:hypothetical protein BDV93DRAFT_502833 [Ceratobasidium sp. AG-I]